MNDTSSSSDGKSTLSHLFTLTLYTIVTVVLLGIAYPLAMTVVGGLLFPHQTAGSYVRSNGNIVGSEYEIGYTAKWLYGVNAIVTAPTGQNGFITGASTSTGNITSPVRSVRSSPSERRSDTTIARTA